MSLNCTACNIMRDINFCRKDRTVCKICYIENKRENNINLYPQIKLLLLTNNQITETLTITKTTTLMF